MKKKKKEGNADNGRRRNARGGGRGMRPRLRRVIHSISHDQRVWTVLFIVVLGAALSQQHCGVSYPEFRSGDIARFDIVAPFDIEMPDEGTTAARRREVRETVRPVFQFDPATGDEIRHRLRQAWQEARNRFDTLGGDTQPSDTEADAIRGLFAPPLSPAAYRVIARRRFDPSLGAAVESILGDLGRRRIVASRALLPVAGGISVRVVGTGDEQILTDLDTVLDLDAAREELSPLLAGVEAVRSADAAVLGDWIEPLLLGNLSYDAAETDRRRDAAAQNLAALVTKIPKGKIIVRKGEEINDEVLARLRFIEDQSGSRPELVSLAGSVLLLVVMVFFLWRYATYHQRFYTRVRDLYLLIVMVNLSILVLARLLVALADRVTETVYLAPFNHAPSYYYAIPVGACAMLLTLLSNARIAMVASVFFSLLFGILLGWDAHWMVFAVLSNFAAIFGITQYRQRTALIRAGAVVGAINGICILALDAAQGHLTPFSRVGLDLAAGFAGGILISIVVSFFLPLLENFFNVLTDVRLLELSNLNNPLLRKLALHAPGSYNHSVMVGTLAEAGAEAIQANSLFCRVAAYYHDVGKMNHPEYYIENMQGGTYRHANLSPSLSVLVIQNHVKEGIEMARAEGLPQPIIDVIPQHHGTRLIRYFYEKAKQEVKGDKEVKKEDFRYPGPKPQTKEAAIFMLADSCEAAARTVDDPSPVRFQTVIRKIFNDIVLDDQLDECDLTFSDLDKIGQAFLKTLLSIYHHRIDYPGFDFGSSDPRSPSRDEPRTEKVAGSRGKEWK